MILFLEDVLPWMFFAFQGGLFVGALFELRWRDRTQEIVDEAIFRDRAKRCATLLDDLIPGPPAS